MQQLWNAMMYVILAKMVTAWCISLDATEDGGRIRQRLGTDTYKHIRQMVSPQSAS